jgi:hypothetical protein
MNGMDVEAVGHGIIEGTVQYSTVQKVQYLCGRMKETVKDLSMASLGLEI